MMIDVNPAKKDFHDGFEVDSNANYEGPRRQEASPPTYGEAMVERFSNLSVAQRDSNPNLVASTSIPKSTLDESFHHSYIITSPSDLITTLHAILVAQSTQPEFKAVVFTHIPRFLTSLFEMSGGAGTVYRNSGHFDHAPRGILFTKYRNDSHIRTKNNTIFIWLNAPAKQRALEQMTARLQDCRAQGKQTLILATPSEQPYLTAQLASST
jgi:hypothetical protein